MPQRRNHYHYVVVLHISPNAGLIFLTRPKQFYVLPLWKMAPNHSPRTTPRRSRVCSVFKKEGFDFSDRCMSKFSGGHFDLESVSKYRKRYRYVLDSDLMATIGPGDLLTSLTFSKPQARRIMKLCRAGYRIRKRPVIKVLLEGGGLTLLSAKGIDPKLAHRPVRGLRSRTPYH